MVLHILNHRTRNLLAGIALLSISAYPALCLGEPIPDQPETNPWACLFNGAANAQLLTDKKTALSIQKATLEQELDELSRKPSASEVTEVTLNEKKSQLIKVVVALECLESRKDDTPPIRAPTSTERGYNVEILSFFATNRRPTGNSDPYKYFGTERDSLQFGKLLVSIPTKRDPGTMENFPFWQRVADADVSKYFVLRQPQLFERKSLNKAIRDALGTSQVQEVNTALVFVHGFNVSFAEAALRTAQITHDISFTGAPIFYSWPSRGASDLAAYKSDAEAANESITDFDSVMDTILAQGFKRVLIVAHSMGGRIVSEVIAKHDQRNRSAAQIAVLAFAAPDISAAYFQTTLAPALKALTDTRFTLYASSNDLTMKISRVVNWGEGARLGDVAVDGKFSMSWMEGIKATNVEYWWRAFGHSYVADSPEVLRDIRLLFRPQRLSPLMRDLKLNPATGYWDF